MIIRGWEQPYMEFASTIFLVVSKIFTALERGVSMPVEWRRGGAWCARNLVSNGGRGCLSESMT